MADRHLFHTKSPDETMRLGMALGQVLHKGDAVLLSGTLGAGKTLFSKGIAKGAGIMDEVTSPTFTIVAEYEGRGFSPFVHMDLYRLYGEDTEALPFEVLDSIGFESYLDGTFIILVEWPKGVIDYFDEAILVDISMMRDESYDERTLSVEAIGLQGKHRLDEWVKQWQF